MMQHLLDELEGGHESVVSGSREGEFGEAEASNIVPTRVRLYRRDEGRLRLGTGSNAELPNDRRHHDVCHCTGTVTAEGG